MTAALIVPVLNNFKGFTELIESVDVPVLPIVIGNWNENIGVGPAWNVGLNRCISNGIEKAIIVNDDVIFRRGVAKQMLDALDYGFDLVSPQNETGVCHPYGLNFWCFAVKPQQFIEKFGEFDENFAPAYYEDDDMAYRIKLAGGKIKTLDSKIYHEVGASGGITDRTIWDRNLNYYRRKWGGEPSKEKYSHPFNRFSKNIKDW